MTAAEDWEPGMPLYRRGAYRSYFFNFRNETDPPASCNCDDAASRPNARSGHRLPDRCAVEAYITEWHGQQEPGRALGDAARGLGATNSLAAGSGEREGAA